MGILSKLNREVSTSLVISDEELGVILQALNQRYGLDFNNYEKIYLKRRINKVIHKFKLESILGLWRKILYDATFIQIFINEITVGLTELFRNPELWQYLRDKIIPQYSSLRILHLGCSTGEEVYSMLITLNESTYPCKAEIIASDINTEVLDTAAQGILYHVDLPVYRKNYRKFTSTYHQLDYYFDCNELESSLKWKGRFQTQLRFEANNLIKDEIVGEFDLIFCRNVLIYFDEPLKIRILEKLIKALKPSGYLALGYYDSVPMQLQNLLLDTSELKIYQKNH